jgi:RNA polymerase sigma factor (sigma-70 family)
MAAATCRNLPELVEACVRSNDQVAQEALVKEILPMIVGVAARSASHWGRVAPELVEDLTQDSLLKLCRNEFAILRRMLDKPELTIRAFIKAVVVNLVHDHFRSERSEKRRPPAGFLPDEVTGLDLGNTAAADALERNLLLDEINRILTIKLSGPSGARDRRVFWLHHRHGITAKALSLIPGIGLSEKGVESALFRMTVLIKEELSESKGISVQGASL